MNAPGSKTRYLRIEGDSEDNDLKISLPEGTVRICRNSDRQPCHITLHPNSSATYIPRRSCHTTFSEDLILDFLDRSGFAWLCDNIARHEDLDSAAGVVEKHLFSYVAPSDFVGKRLLDFGCGDGASTLAMARLLPQTDVVGVELDPVRVDAANRVRAFRRAENATFLCSASSRELPQGLGSFDFVMLSAVYEHLLPLERRTVMPLLWSAMKPGGRIFINQTPYRYSPLEAHSTGLWFVNYLPDKLAHRCVRLLAGRNPAVNQSRDWNVHLRSGLRGGTEKEIVRDLTAGACHTARVLQPGLNGAYDRASLWLSSTNPKRLRILKRMIAAGFRVTDRLWGTIPALNLELVVEKRV
jgi:2-polyprenyl-3-methyl-5-hydroxy-6-metoxy-1,4-benzoquinol methylase